MRHGRWALLMAVTLLCGVAAVWLFQRGPGLDGLTPGCMFRNVTGLHCPGCGMTRATHALMHGDVATAFRFNPVGFVLFPVALAATGLEAIAWALVVILIGFWILRNLPWWPFTLLAPP